MKKVAIIDYGSGNLHSAAKAFERAGKGIAEISVTSNPADLKAATHIVLPGVGAFADCKRGLESVKGMIAALETEVLKNKKPFFGICVGMQLLATTGLEHGEHKGLGWIKGTVKRLEPKDSALKIPHMGWNSLVIAPASLPSSAMSLSPSGTKGGGLLAATPHTARRSPLPIFGICLGHQMLGIALCAKTEKMKQGHRGANHPVQDLRSKKVEITSQNHGFVVSDKDLPDTIEVTHRSLFDGTIQGIRAKNYSAFSVQGHPEASPGPHDTHYIFAEFVQAMKGAK